MKAIVLDTNVLIRFFAHIDKIPKSFSSYETVLIPSTVIGEYRAGLYDTRTGNENARKLSEYLSRTTVRIVPVGERTAEMYAKVYQALRAQGRPIPQNDIWIAASALEHGADIATHDEHFRLIPMLTVIIP